MNRIFVAGVGVDKVNEQGALDFARQCLDSNKQCKIFTPNPEMVVKAQKDENFKQTLNSGDLNICDGRGLQWAMNHSHSITPTCHSECSEESTLQPIEDPSRSFGMTKEKAERISGIDFMLALCELAAKNNKSIYLLGSGDRETVRLAAENLQKQFSGLRVAGYDEGPMINDCHSEHIRSAQYKLREESLSNSLNGQGSFVAVAPQDDSSVIQKINQSTPTILFVAFGMGKQEKWIVENLPKMPGVRIAMGVGGSFEFIAGKIKRAPCWMRKIGLEWLYRLCRQPSRIGRIFNATAKFTVLIFKENYANPRRKV